MKNIRLWLAGAAGAAALATMLAFAPISSAQEGTNTPDTAQGMHSMMYGRGHGQGNGTPQGDGTCDGTNYVDADGDGVCDNMGSGTNDGSGTNYVDADGDGVCDNMKSGTGNQSRGNRP